MQYLGLTGDQTAQWLIRLLRRYWSTTDWEAACKGGCHKWSRQEPPVHADHKQYWPSGDHRWHQLHLMDGCNSMGSPARELPAITLLELGTALAGSTIFRSIQGSSTVVIVFFLFLQCRTQLFSDGFLDEVSCLLASSTRSFSVDFPGCQEAGWYSVPDELASGPCEAPPNFPCEAWLTTDTDKSTPVVNSTADAHHAHVLVQLQHKER